jgi:hypothetical protein
MVLWATQPLTEKVRNFTCSKGILKCKAQNIKPICEQNFYKSVGYSTSHKHTGLYGLILDEAFHFLVP